MTAPNEPRKRRARGTGRVYKRKRSRYWYIRWCVNGKRHSRATGTTVREDAERMLRAELTATDRGENPDARKLKFEDLIDLLIADRLRRGRRSRPKIKHLREAFGKARVLRITGASIARFERDRMEAGACRATINNELAALRRMFNLAIEQKMLTREQVPVIHTPDPKNARTGFFEAADFEAVIKELPDYLRGPMRFGYLTGWRVQSEVLPLQWRQVDFDHGTVRLEPNTTKNDEGRVFPFSNFPALKRLLDAQRDATKRLEKATGRIIPHVFHRNGQPIWDYRGAWRGALIRAAVEERDGVNVVVRPQLAGRLVHDLRRTAVRNLERAGVPRSAAMKLTGHKTESVYRRYAIVAESDLRDAVAKLAQLGATRPQAAKS